MHRVATIAHRDLGQIADILARHVGGSDATMGTPNMKIIFVVAGVIALTASPVLAQGKGQDKRPTTVEAGKSGQTITPGKGANDTAGNPNPQTPSASTPTPKGKPATK